MPASCAKCHSLYGYLDFLGADGTAAGQVDGPARVGSVLYCNTCHNTSAHEWTTVEFPSGIEVEEPSGNSDCMQCHQGRQATTTVNEAIAGLDLDTVSEALGFINVHYAIAAATQLGDEAQIGYQYAEKSYVGRYEHAEDYSTCVECHDPHSTSINPDTCSPCHLNVVDNDDLRDIRQDPVDYDGDGDTDEPIADEIAKLHESLYAALQDYAATVIGTPIVYDGSAFPYYFIDLNANGVADSDEVNYGNRYVTWTPRLVRTVYNYNYVLGDHGAYAHNPRYVLQLLYDGLEDLAEAGAAAPEIERYTRP
ncbi:MAG: polyheme membrane-associated cytochrome C [Chloroflexi bacterium]|nr:polyheme membrane-associated cytochrome C [Chloroflexota bacterium]